MVTRRRGWSCARTALDAGVANLAVLPLIQRQADWPLQVCLDLRASRSYLGTRGVSTPTAAACHPRLLPAHQSMQEGCQGRGFKKSGVTLQPFATLRAAT